MARARNLKPGFFKNEDLAECSPWARLCFAGLWTLADRDGRLEDRPKRIKGELFAFDSVEVDPLLRELSKYGFIERYQAADGRGLIQVTEFAKHQNPHHREPESDFPPPKSPGLAPVGNSPKPEALAPCDEAKALGQTEARPGLYPPQSDLARGSSRAESGIDESRTLIPEEKQTARKRAVPIVVQPDALISAGFDAITAAEFLAHKAQAKAPLTKRAWADHCSEALKAGWSPLQAAEKVMAKGWKGFEAKYVAGETPRRANGNGGETAYQRSRRENVEAFTGGLVSRKVNKPEEPTHVVTRIE